MVAVIMKENIDRLLEIDGEDCVVMVMWVPNTSGNVIESPEKPN